jgi:hypothetical protein
VKGNCPVHGHCWDGCGRGSADPDWRSVSVAGPRPVSRKAAAVADMPWRLLMTPSRRRLCIAEAEEMPCRARLTLCNMLAKGV